MDPVNWTSIWSAVAATFSVIAAWLALRINIRNYYDAVRPELVIGAWRFDVEKFSEGLGFDELKNYGKGPALRINFNISVYSMTVNGQRYTSELLKLSYVNLSCLPVGAILPNEKGIVQADCFMKLIDHNGIPIDVDKNKIALEILLELSYEDVRDRRYTQYLLLYIQNHKMPLYGIEKIRSYLYLKSSELVVKRPSLKTVYKKRRYIKNLRRAGRN